MTPENLRNLPQLRHESRLRRRWLARQLEQTAPSAYRQVHSCLPSSKHPPGMATLWALEIFGQWHQPIGNQVFGKGMPIVTNNKGTFLYLALLLLQLIIVQRFSTEIQHAPPCWFGAQMFISSKVLNPLKMMQQSLMPMHKDRDILSAHLAKEVAWLFGGVCWSC